MTSFGGHFGIWPIKRVTYGCQSGNQAIIVLKWPQYKNHQEKVKWSSISRLPIDDIVLSNRLIWDFLMKYVIFPQNIKNIDLTYKQMLPNEREHQITIENMFWYSISVYINLLWAFSRNLRYSFQIAGFHLKPLIVTVCKGAETRNWCHFEEQILL